MSVGECDSGLPSPGLASSLSSFSSFGEGGGVDHEVFLAESRRGGLPRWLTGAPKASDIYQMHLAAQRALQGTEVKLDVDPRATGSRPPQELLRPTQLEAPIRSRINDTPDDFNQSVSPWLRRHPILGPWLGPEPVEFERAVSEVATLPEEAPEASPKASLLAAPSEATEGARPMESEILKLLNELLKGQQEAFREKEAATSTAKVAELANEAAKLARSAMQATRKQHLSVSTFLALGVKDHRMLLLDCFLAWSGERSRAPRSKIVPEVIQEKLETKEATAQVCSDDERPNLLQVETLQGSACRRVLAGRGAVPPILPGFLRALPGEEVTLADDGSIRGASLLLSMRPPRATRPFLRSFDICQQAEVDFSRPCQEVSIQTSPRGGMESEVGEGPPEPEEDAGLSPEQVLRRIQGLQEEMTEMETSLEQLRRVNFEGAEEAFDEAPVGHPVPPANEAAPLPVPVKRMSRLRQRLPQSLAWLEEAARRPPKLRARKPNLPRM